MQLWGKTRQGMMCIYKTDDGKCKKFSTDTVTSYCVESPCEHEKLSNYDRIRNMSVEELAKLLCNCSDCGNGRCYGDKLCTQDDGACNGLIKWLESEVTE